MKQSVICCLEMELFTSVLVSFIVNAMLVTGEELLLLTYEHNIYRHNTYNRTTKKIADQVESIACDYNRKVMYYIPTLGSKQGFARIVRVNQYGGDMKVITDKADVTIFSIGVDQETGNLYYNSLKGIGFLSYSKNYTNTIVSTAPLSKAVILDYGFHGKGTNRRVYLSTALNNVYRLHPGTSKLIHLGRKCHHFIILNKGMVCMSDGLVFLHLTNLDGVEIESLPNITITSSRLADIDCEGHPEDIIEAGGNIYILCSDPNQILKLVVKDNIFSRLILWWVPGLSQETWYSLCVWPESKSVISPQKPHEKSVISSKKPQEKSVISPSPSQTATKHSGSEIVIVIGIVAGIVALLAINAVVIIKCKNKTKKRNVRNSNETLGQPNTQDNRREEGNVYVVMPSAANLELNTAVKYHPESI